MQHNFETLLLIIISAYSCNTIRCNRFDEDRCEKCSHAKLLEQSANEKNSGTIFSFRLRKKVLYPVNLIFLYNSVIRINV